MIINLIKSGTSLELSELNANGEFNENQFVNNPPDITGINFTVGYSIGKSGIKVSPNVYTNVGEHTITFTFGNVSTSKTVHVFRGLPVGGVIFYIDSTADGTYQFYDANGNSISEPTVGTDCTNWGYEVTGATKDKFYVYYPTLVASKYWGYYDITTSATGNSIGAGKTNTSTVLAITDTSQYASGSIWEYIKDMRTNKTNGCDDWFVGCQAEYNQLRSSGTTGASWFSFKDIWSSNEYSYNNYSYAYCWYEDDSFWSTTNKYDKYALVPLRAF